MARSHEGLTVDTLANKRLQVHPCIHQALIALQVLLVVLLEALFFQSPSIMAWISYQFWLACLYCL
jgi:hypothetical protein